MIATTVTCMIAILLLHAWLLLLLHVQLLHDWLWYA